MSVPSTLAEAPSVATRSSTSSVKTRKSVQNLNKIDLIGKTSHNITGAKLPSNKQVLQVLFYNMRFVRLSAKESANLAIAATKLFWQQARIPVRDDHKCAEKLLKLYENWKAIQKTVPHKRSDAQNKVAEAYVENLDDLFDIATTNALEIIKIEEDKQFLEMQRQASRPGCMAGVDMNLYGREKRKEYRIAREQELKRKHQEEMSQQNGILSFEFIHICVFIKKVLKTCSC